MDLTGSFVGNMKDGFLSWISTIPKALTSLVVSLFGKWGINVSQGWATILVILIFALIIYGALKIAKPILKVAIIILSILLVLSFLIPW